MVEFLTECPNISVIINLPFLWSAKAVATRAPKIKIAVFILQIKDNNQYMYIFHDLITQTTIINLKTDKWKYNKQVAA